MYLTPQQVDTLLRACNNPGHRHWAHPYGLDHGVLTGLMHLGLVAGPFHRSDAGSELLEYRLTGDGLKETERIRREGV